MAYIVVQLEVPDAIVNLNASCNEATKPHESLSGLIDLLNGINGGLKAPVTAKIGTSSADSSGGFVITGTGSQLNTFQF
jgi:hypothetical protein